MMAKSADVAGNETAWDAYSDEYEGRHGEQLGRHPRAWGAFSIPEDRLHVLGDVRDRDVLELGCGAARWSIALAQEGARATALDLSTRQLAHAKTLVKRAGAQVTLVHGDAEQLPFADASFDVVFCDHGAMTFADPAATVPGVARVLRPGGLFAFSCATPFHATCETPDGVASEFTHDYYGLYRVHDDDTVGFVLTYGAAIRLFRANGFEVLDLIELQPPADGVTSYEGFISLEWARRWPAEHIWKLRKRG